MTCRRWLVLSVLGAGLLAAACATSPRTDPRAATADGLLVTGALPRTGTLSRSELEAIGTVDGHWTHREKEHSFRGAPLDAVLIHMGFERGDMGPELPKSEKAAGWKKVVVATAADGFEAVFSCAELMPSMGPTRAFVVWEMDGAPLPADQGPLRLLVTTDKEGSRSPYALRGLEVLDIRHTAGKHP